mgnify:CR=1 FL=1
MAILSRVRLINQLVLLESFLKDVEKLIDTTIKVCGWIQTIRKQTPLAFIQLTDGSSQKTLQIVCSPDYTDISKYQNKMIPARYCRAGVLFSPPYG